MLAAALSATALFACVVAGCGREAPFPSRPVVLICPWSAGGGTDRVARHLAARLEGELGVPVNVVNATGGAGVTGHTRGMLARPNGYTLCLATAELNMLHWRGLTNITYRDFQPLMLVNRDDAALFVRADGPWASLAELEAAVRGAPGTLRASGTAHGGIWHVSLVGWLATAGLDAADMIWISINGAAPSLQELMAGGVDVVCCSLPEAQSLLDAGRIRCLGLMAAERLASYPAVPTLKEQGEDWAMGTWRGLMLPKGVSPARLNRLAEAVASVATSDEYLGFMARSGFNPAAEPADRFEASLAALDVRFGEILKSEAFQEGQAQRFGPMFFPWVLGALLAVNLIVLIAARTLRRGADAERVTRQGLARIALVCGAVVAYIALAEWLGFLLTAGVLLFVLLWRFGVRWYTAAAVSVVLVVCVYQVFAVYLRVPLPAGWWGG
ncbi:MAG: tripartite tricarboxylate transporter TctB family protein [Candidatus Hydrogenedentes bacterium]|nr:tripartite tricarboxylate transporter TctB family protein [Candidatus Hydrogenedentota bacterium]